MPENATQKGQAQLIKKMGTSYGCSCFVVNLFEVPYLLCVSRFLEPSFDYRLQFTALEGGVEKWSSRKTLQ